MHRDLKNLYDEQKVEIDAVGTSRLKQHDKDGKGTGKHDSSRNPRQSVIITIMGNKAVYKEDDDDSKEGGTTTQSNQQQTSV